MKNRSLRLAALSVTMLLSAQPAASAKMNTAFDPGTNDSPTANSGIYISDGTMITGGGSGATAKA
ncbi:MAG: hypothetical protein WAT81_04930, partial [Candidatus Moraniibacteriota bacterium]